MAADQNVFANGIKLVGEAAISPGTGLLLDGKIGYGLLHVGLAAAATAALGPVGAGIARLVLMANSYSNSVNNVGLLDLGKAAMGGVNEVDGERAPVHT